MRKSGENCKLLKMGQIECLTPNIQRGYSVFAMNKSKTKAKIMPKVAIVPTAEEMEIINYGRKKHGLKNASEILRMALRRFAEAEGLKAS